MRTSPSERERTLHMQVGEGGPRDLLFLHALEGLESALWSRLHERAFRLFRLANSRGHWAQTGNAEKIFGFLLHSPLLLGELSKSTADAASRAEAVKRLAVVSKLISTQHLNIHDLWFGQVRKDHGRCSFVEVERILALGGKGLRITAEQLRLAIRTCLEQQSRSFRSSDRSRTNRRNTSSTDAETVEQNGCGFEDFCFCLQVIGSVAGATSSDPAKKYNDNTLKQRITEVRTPWHGHKHCDSFMHLPFEPSTRFSHRMSGCDTRSRLPASLPPSLSWSHVGHILATPPGRRFPQIPTPLRS